VVVEIGAGTGTITRELASRCRRVIAIERDPRLAAVLRRRFDGEGGVRVVEADARAWSFPDEPFRVVGNLPFAITTAMLRRLLSDPASRLVRADLVVQLEVAIKRSRRPPASALSLGWAPWWGSELVRRIPARWFLPAPSVDAAVIVYRRRSPPLLPAEERSSFEGFVRTLFRGADRPLPSALGAMCDPTSARRLTSDVGLPHRMRPVDLEAEQAVAVFRRWRAGRPADLR
jgi:23S rRNA (adenine-N6)-dimethyltransferase